MYVYLLESVAFPGRRYVGLTIDLHHRLDDHNAGKSPHTSKYRPWQIVAAVWFADRAKAKASRGPRADRPQIAIVPARPVV